MHKNALQTATVKGKRLGARTTRTQTDAAGATTYSYDPLYRLKTADTPGTSNDELFTYDKVGNRKSATLGSLSANTNTRYYNYVAGSNRLQDIRIGSAAGARESGFTHDLEGRLTAQTGTGAKTFTWDAKGRVKTLTQSAATETYTYDPGNHRIGRSGGTLGSLDYFLEGEHLESIYSGVNLQAKYFRGASTDELVAGYLYDTDAKLKPYLFHHDNVTSTTAVSGHNGGTIQSVTYGAFGNTQSSTGTSPNRLKYTGREDDGTSLYYYRARYYSPQIGRFISEDPLGFAAGINFYAYVGNNPVNFNDPSGQIIPAIAALWQSAPVWVPAVVTVVRTAFTVATSFVSSNAGLVAGTIGGASGAAGYVATTSNPTVLGATVAGGMGVVQGVATVYLPGSGTLWQGATIAGAGNVVTQGLNMAQGTQASFNYTELGLTSLGGAAASKLTSVFGPTWSQQAAAVTIAWPVETSFGAIGESLGTPSPSYTSSDFTDFGSPNLDFSIFAGTDGFAGGGFLLYPNKFNTNMMQSVYAK